MHARISRGGVRCSHVANNDSVIACVNASSSAHTLVSGD